MQPVSITCISWSVRKRGHVPNRTLTIEQVLTILSETPSRIAALTAVLASVQLRTPAAQGEWSINEVLAHLRACADVWGNCIVTIIDQDLPTIRAVNPRTWIKETNYLEQKFRPSLQAFTVQRTALLMVLGPLPPETWSRSATVTGVGKVLEWTVLHYTQRLARHERLHLKQIKRIVNTLHTQRTR